MEKADTPKERIAKRMASAGLCSRRDAEKWIVQGRVAVNGAVIDTPATLVDAADHIVVDGTPLAATKPPAQLWLYHKPTGLVTTHADPQGRPTVFDDLPPTLGRVISVGRLDLNSEGLLLLTNSGELARQLEHPTTGLPRTYDVRAYGDWHRGLEQDLAQGVTIDGVHYAPIHVERMFDRALTGRNIALRMTLHEGKNREIRRVLQACGLHVNRLVRVAYGPFELSDLERGQVVEAKDFDKQLNRFFSAKN